MTSVPTDYRQSVAFEVRSWGEIKKGYTHVANGDIVVAKITPCFQNGKACVMKGLPHGYGAGTTELLVLRPESGVVESTFLLLFFKSPEFVAGGVARMTGTAGQQRVPGDYFGTVPLPLPPLAEQKRIVAKVDQLMALCDDLEARQERKRDIGTRLTKASLEALTSAEGLDEFQAAWQRALATFELMIGAANAVPDLRKTILSLAVLGRLAAVKAGGPPEVPSGEAYDPDFSIPKHWRWSPLGGVCKFIDYRGRTPKKTTGGVRLITAKNVRMGILRKDPEEFIAAADYDGWMTRGLPQQDDVLFTTEAPLGNVAQLVTNERIALAQRIIALRPISAVNAAFLKTILMSPLVQNVIRSHATGMTATGIKAAKLKLIPIPIPPIMEQLLIVAKVDRLMTVCDDLEGHLRRVEDRGAALVEAVAHGFAREKDRLTDAPE